MSTIGWIMIGGVLLTAANGYFWWHKGWTKGRDDAGDSMDNWFDKNMRGADIEDIPDYVEQRLYEGYSEYTPVLVIDPGWVQYKWKVDPIPGKYD